MICNVNHTSVLHVINKQDSQGTTGQRVYR
uniref:Uncharacterized protein n=1 Tax=Ciona intestinalis TaxID=7719 RepID=H2XLT8_CIOIN